MLSSAGPGWASAESPGQVSEPGALLMTARTKELNGQKQLHLETSEHPNAATGQNRTLKVNREDAGSAGSSLASTYPTPAAKHPFSITFLIELTLGSGS